MNALLGRFNIDVETWKKVIEADKESHREAGLHFKSVWQNADNPKEIYFLFAVDDPNRARSFLEKAGALDEDKASRGEIPQLTFLTEA